MAPDSRRNLQYYEITGGVEEKVMLLIMDEIGQIRIKKSWLT